MNFLYDFFSIGQPYSLNNHILLLLLHIEASFTFPKIEKENNESKKYI